MSEKMARMMNDPSTGCDVKLQVQVQWVIRWETRVISLSHINHRISCNTFTVQQVHIYPCCICSPFSLSLSLSLAEKWQEHLSVSSDRIIRYEKANRTSEREKKNNSSERSQSDPPIHSHFNHTPIQVHLSLRLSKCQSCWVRVRFVCNKQKVPLLLSLSFSCMNCWVGSMWDTWYSKHCGLRREAHSPTEFHILYNWRSWGVKFAHPFVSVTHRSTLYKI